MGRNRKTLEEMTFSDDFIFYKVMEREGIAKRFIEILMEKKIKYATPVVLQSFYKSGLDTHGIRFDVRFEGDDTIYCIEMQQAGGTSELQQSELLRRVRYYQSSIDSKHFDEGKPYRDLKPSLIVFICRFDPFGFGCAKYTQKPYIEETCQVVDNGAGVIYLNSEFSIGNVNSNICLLLNYLSAPDSVDWTQSQLVKDVHLLVEEVKTEPTVRSDYMWLKEMMEEERLEERDHAAKVMAANFGCSYEEALKMLERPDDDISSIKPMKL